MKDIENKTQILFFFNSLIGKKIMEDELFEFKMEFTEVIFKPRNKKKKIRFCKQMGIDVFEAILSDLELPYVIVVEKEYNKNIYTVKKEREDNE